MSGPERAKGGGLVAHPPRITDPEAPLRLLHKGFDGLDVAFQGALLSADIEILEAARTQAEVQNHPLLVKIGPGEVAMHVASTGAPGGYRYRCDTGFMGAIIFFKRGQSCSDWNVRISVKSLPLAISGISAVWQDLKELLDKLGIGDAQESISRVDFAVDFLMPTKFCLKADQFVAHARTTISEYSVVPERSDNSEEEFQIHLSRRVPSSVTLGKMPNRQLIIYNKRKEAIQRQKLYWFDLWGIDIGDENAAIWRVEVRAGKAHLNFWKIKTFLDLTNQFGDLIAGAMSTVRYLQGYTSDTNISRSPPHALWEAAEREMAQSLFNYRSGIIPENIIEGEQRRIAENYNSQIAAFIPGALVANGYPVENGVNSVAKYLAMIERRVKSHPEKFQEKLLLAKDRLHFTAPKRNQQEKDE